MSTRLRVVHRTGFRYAAPVVASYNEARMTPPTIPGQTVLHARVDLEPMTWTHTYWDYWGTQVTAFEVLAPHSELTVTATSVTEVDGGRPGAGADAGWDALSRESVRDEHAEFLSTSRTTRPPAELVEVCTEAASGLEPAAAARAVCELVGREVAYVPGSTGVHTAAAEAWEERKGVCQDLAHLAVGALRQLGIPARYVSGYLHPRKDAEVGEVVTGESHAWVEWWSGGWRAFDPTNGGPTGELHVVVGRGRDYFDVTPLRGVYSGSASSSLFVSVEVTRL